MLRKAMWAGVGGLALATGYWLGSPPSRTELIFLSVGQGDCAVFRHQGTTVLIDTGPANEYSDAGARLVAPALRRLGVSRIDLVVLSHPDGDHIGGLPALCRRFSVSKVVVPGHFRENKDLQSAFLRSKLKQDQVIWMSGQQRAHLGQFALSFITPEWNQGDPDNDGSLIFEVSNGKASALFMGDLSSDGEDRLAQKAIDWSAQVIKIGHHGSHFSTGDRWISKVQPKYAILSVGRNNSYGHPSKEVVDRLKSHRVQMERTDKLGDIKFEVDESGFRLQQ